MSSRPVRICRIAALAGCLLLAACSRSLQLYTGLGEADANEVVAALLEGGIHAGKASAKQGFVVTVEQSELAAAVALLHERGLPRDGFSRMGDVFKKDGMISTPTEERARYLSVLASELENTLSRIDGVVLARVHPVLPERLVPGEPVLPSSCAVLIKYRPGWDPDAYEDRIRRLVLASIPGLAKSEFSANRVSVVFVAAEQTPEALPPPAGAARYWWAGLALALAVLSGGGAYAWRWRRQRQVQEGAPRLEPA